MRRGWRGGPYHTLRLPQARTAHTVAAELSDLQRAIMTVPGGTGEGGRARAEGRVVASSDVAARAAAPPPARARGRAGGLEHGSRNAMNMKYQAHCPIAGD